MKKALAYRGQGGQNTDTDFLALRLKVRGGSLPSEFKSCDSKIALSIDWMRFGWRFWIDFPRFYFTQGGPGSVWLRFGDGTVRADPVFGSGGSSKEGGFLCFSTISHRGRFRFRFLETVPAVPVPRSVPAKTVPAVPVSGSGSVPGPPCVLRFDSFFLLAAEFPAIPGPRFLASR